MANILLINTNCSWNKGSAAQVVSVIGVLREMIPDVKFTLISHCPELDSEGCLGRGIEVISYPSRKPHHRKALLAFSYHLTSSLLCCFAWRLLKSVKINAPFLVEETYCRAYFSSDIVLDLSGDSFSDKGAFSLINMLGILIALVLRKPVAIYSQSIGPFRKLTMPLAKLCLNRARLITVREEISRRYLERIGVNKTPICQAADCAFALSPVTPEKAREILDKEGIRRNNSPLVGVSVSGVMAGLTERNTSNLPAPENKGNSYFTLIAQLVNFLTENMQMQVVLIPHVIAPSWWLPDDRCICREIHRLVKDRAKSGFIGGDYTPEELKGVIGRCDLFIGSRMHANIAALSMCVPTIALGWSHKYKGVMERLGLGEYVCEFNTVNLERLLSKVSDVWTRREEIRGLLASKMKEERKSVHLSAKLIKELIDSLNAG